MREHCGRRGGEWSWSMAQRILELCTGWRKGGPLLVSTGLNCGKKLPGLVWAPRPVRRFGGKKEIFVFVVNLNLSIRCLFTMPTELLLCTCGFLRRSAARDWAGDIFGAQTAVWLPALQCEIYASFFLTSYSWLVVGSAKLVHGNFLLSFLLS